MTKISDASGVTGVALTGSDVSSSAGMHCQRIHVGGRLRCEWCGVAFDARSRSGRLPRFCRASHRVRACERRRGLLRAGSAPVREVLPVSGRQGLIGVEPRKLVYFQHERGLSPWVDYRQFAAQRIHRVRVGGVPGRELVPSLCGVMVRAVGNPVQARGLFSTCRSCESLAGLHPVDPGWWNAMTQRVGTALLDDLRSTVLAVGQAVAGVRDRDETLERADRELRRLASAVGLTDPGRASLHHRSAQPT
jgi:hypothetical protein